jgi:hypothetical protein
VQSPLPGPSGGLVVLLGLISDKWQNVQRA